MGWVGGAVIVVMETEGMGWSESAAGDTADRRRRTTLPIPRGHRRPSSFGAVTAFRRCPFHGADLRAVAQHDPVP
jgi:hypothetical protein